MERDLVDGGDRGAGVGVCGEQHPHRLRVELARLAQEADAAHPGHALVHEQERDRAAPPPELVQRLQRIGARRRGQDPVAIAEVSPEIALDGGQDLAIVIHREDDRFSHGSSVPDARAT